ncbi:hypothetical protein MPSEU_000724000 [Mayamaea pseudoterrestris]|nr:hypothetical protein MPSEU_000724000 [Mayamaea pseudoterrestris]
MHSSQYEPVSVAEEALEPPPDSAVYRIDEDDEDASVAPFSIEEPFEIEQQLEILEADAIDLSPNCICLVLSAGVTFLLTSPVLVLTAWTFHMLIGRAWVATPFILHSVVALTSCRLSLMGSCRKAAFIYNIIDALLFFFAYNAFYKFVIQQLLTDIDGTPVIEYTDERYALTTFQRMGLAIAVFRVVLVVMSFAEKMSEYFALRSRQCHRSSSCISPKTLVHVLQQFTMALLALTVGLLLWCIISVLVHFIKWPPPLNKDPGCDPIDTTECWLPYPSFHHMRRDMSTETGWRVDLKADILPRLKGGVKMDPAWLNDKDGFSTMGPILFYVDGLKEAHEAKNGQLQGHANIAKSTTRQSITLLLDVNTSKLVAHSAEIDYLDAKHPQVMLFPAYPLQHANHYAVALFNATGVNGEVLAASDGMVDLFMHHGGPVESERWDRYTNSIIPSLRVAAPWMTADEKNLNGLQILFDFVTSSEQSQLGHVRAVRDATLSFVGSTHWIWKDHYREVQRTVYDCSLPDTRLARTVHGELDVPWFLDCFGPGGRHAFLDEDALQSNIPTAIGKAKFLLHIPCSLRDGALGLASGKPLRAVMEFGHGLFGNRAESYDSFLQQLANDEGYAITAMDWRGMSSFDLLVVGRMLLSRPRLFRSVRDNLIQGYANKYALQHWSRSGELQKSNAFVFDDVNGYQVSVRMDGNMTEPSFVFYGISQGGILGAGYAALSVGLIDRAVLGVPGTPFALVMSRSHDFIGYDILLLLDLYDNRQVRMLLALCQLGWDSLEGAGVLATPVSEPFPPMLLQAGLGDAVVPTFAAEALARGFGAVILPGNPRNIYGIDVDHFATEPDHQPRAILTELLYEQEYLGLSVDNKIGSPNSVHDCVRRDGAMIKQVTAFLSRGEIINPCLRDGCIRHLSDC